MASGTTAMLRRACAITPLSTLGVHVRPARSILSNALNFCRSATRSRWQRTVWQIVEHVIVRIVIDDRRKRRITLPRIIALWRINQRWRVGLSRRVVLRESPPSQRPDAD